VIGVGNPRTRQIKQHRRIKRVFGTSANAVRSQVLIAVAINVLVAIICKRWNLRLSLHAMVQILSVDAGLREYREVKCLLKCSRAA